MLDSYIIVVVMVKLRRWRAGEVEIEALFDVISQIRRRGGWLGR